MAWDDVTFGEGFGFYANRGNIGTLVDITYSPMTNYYFLTVPLITQVQSGVQYGQQGTELTGTYTGGGGGGNTYTRSRVVNRA